MSEKNQIGNEILDNNTIFFAVFFTQLSAIVAQVSLRSDFLELTMQILIWGVMLGFSLAFGWSYLHKTSRLPEQMTQGVALVGLFAFLFQLFTKDLTSALLLMISWLLIALSFSFKTQRNLYFSLLASTVLLLYASSISKSSSFIIYIVIYTLAAIIALASNYYLSKNKQQISYSQEQKNFPFKLPIAVVAGLVLIVTATLYLFVPRPSAMNWGVFPAGGGHYFADNSWPNDGDKSSDNQLDDIFDNAMERLKENGVDQATLDQLKENGFQENLAKLKDNTKKIKKQMDDKFDSESFHYSGFNESLSLNDNIEQGSENTSYGDGEGKADRNALIFYMDGKEPQYMRGKVYDYFDGLSWKISDQKKERIDRKQNKFTLNHRLKDPFDLYTVRMAVNMAGTPTIFAPVASAEMQFPSNAIGRDNYGALFSPRRIQKNTFYSIKVKPKGSRIQGRPVDNTDEPTDDEFDQYTQLPNNLSERFYNFSRKISNGAQSTINKATNIEQYLRNNYQYSFESITSSQGKIPLEEFLFDRPEGHCEYFATAMVALMRAQKIPARLVTGFSVSTYNPVTGYYEARGLDAHAWAEIWVPDAGWVTFEATPPYNLPIPSESQNTSQSMEAYLKERYEDAQFTDPESIQTALINTGKSIFEQLNMLVDRLWTGITGGVNWTGTMILYYGWLVLLLLGVVFSVIHYLRYYFVHNRIKKELTKAKKLSLNKQIKLGYGEMESLFSLYQHPRPEDWTLHQYKHYLCQHYPDLETDISHISNTLNHTLYDSADENNIQRPSEQALADAVDSMFKITQYKFEIPIPAEKQILALNEFVNGLLLRPNSAKNE